MKPQPTTPPTNETPFPHELTATLAADRAFPAPDQRDPLYAHEYLKIGICRQGTGAVVTEQQTLPYSAGFLCVIPPYCRHSITQEQPSDWTFVFVDAVGVAARIYPDQPAARRKLLWDLNEEPIVTHHGRCRAISNLATLLAEELTHERELGRENVCGLCWLLLIAIVRRQRARGARLTVGGHAETHGEQVQPALQYIHDHYAEPLKILSIAEVCHMSESHFRRLFQDQTRMAPADYLNQIRVQKACEYIRQDKYTMEEIGRRVGYSSTSTFYRNFKKVTGMSPYQWQKTKT